MSPWLSLTDIVHVLHRRLQRLPHINDIAASGDIKLAAAVMAAASRDLPQARLPVFINLCAYAIASPARIVLYQPTRPVVDLVDGTDLRSVPSRRPFVFDRPFILASRDPQYPLVPPTAEIGCYAIGETFFLIGLNYPDGVWTSSFRPTWTGEDLDDGRRPAALEPWVPVERRADYDVQNLGAIRFALVLALLLEAEGAPIRVEEKAPGNKTARRRAERAGAEPSWTERRIYLEARAATRRPPSTSDSDPHELGHLVEDKTRVTGHLKMQAHGPGGKLRKVLYVEGYERRQWVAPYSRTIVSTSPE